MRSQHQKTAIKRHHFCFLKTHKAVSIQRQVTRIWVMNFKCRVPQLLLILQIKFTSSSSGEWSSRVCMRVLGISLAANHQCLAGTREPTEGPWSHIPKALDIRCAQGGTCAVWCSCTGHLEQKSMTEMLCKLGEISVIVNTSMVWPQGRSSSMSLLNKTPEIPIQLGIYMNVQLVYEHGGPSSESFGLHLGAECIKGHCSLRYGLLPLMTVCLSTIRSVTS